MNWFVIQYSRMPDFENILDKLHRRPAMYTGENTLTSIQQFLSGYSFAVMRNELSTEDDPLILPREFHDWVAYRLHFYESTSGWCNMICDRSETNQAAINKFFSLLAEFKTRKPHVVARLIGFRKTYERSTVDRDEKGQVIRCPSVTRSYPGSISLVTYTTDPGFFAYSDTLESFPSEGFFPDLDSFELRTGADRSMLTIIDDQWDHRPQ